MYDGAQAVHGRTRKGWGVRDGSSLRYCRRILNRMNAHGNSCGCDKLRSNKNA